MAELANRYSDNIAGRYYVDTQCIDCDLCRQTAPQNFDRNQEGGYSYVKNQATTPDEEAQCKEALEGCPVEAIGDNGSADAKTGPAQPKEKTDQVPQEK